MAESRSHPALWLLALAAAACAVWVGLEATDTPAVPVQAEVGEQEAERAEYEARDASAGRGETGAGSDRSGDPGSRITREAGGESGAARVVGRLLDVQGAPLSQHAFGWSLRGEVGTQARGAEQTDAEGRFAIPIRSWSEGQRSLAIQVWPEGAESGTPRAGVRVGLGKPDESGQLDVGDVQLLAYTLLASGRVEDDLGRPIPMATVSALDPTFGVQFGSFGGSTRNVFLSAGSTEIHIGEVAPLETTRVILSSTREVTPQDLAKQLQSVSAEVDSIVFEELSEELLLVDGQLQRTLSRERGRAPLGGVLARAVTDEDGAFQLYGPSSSQSVRLRAEAEEHFRTEQELTVLGAFVTLRLRRVCEVRAEVYVPDGLPERVVRFRLEGDDWSVAPKESIYGPGPDGVNRFELVFWDVPVGPARFRTRISHLEESARTVDGLVIDPERPVGLEQLQPLDLRAGLFRYRLRAVHPNRRPVGELTSPFLLHIPGGKRERVVGLDWIDGHVEFFSARPKLEATLLLPGHRRERIEVQAGERDVVYTPIHPVRVVLPGLREAAQDTDRVRVSMILRGSTGLPQSIRGHDVRTGKGRSYSRWHMGQSGGAWLGETDEVEVPLVIDGPYDVSVRLQRLGAPGEESITVGRIDLELQNLAAEQHVVEIDRNAIRSAVDRQRARAAQARSGR